MVQLGNLATSLDDKEKMRLSGEALEAFEQDIEDCQGHIDTHKVYLEIYHQIHNPSTTNATWQSDSSIPLLAEAVNQFQARAYKAFFPSRDFISAITTEDVSPQALEAAERVGKYLSYKLTIEDRYYKQDKNAMFQAAALHGYDYTKTYYNPTKGRVCVDRVRGSDLVVPYYAGSCRIDDLERKSHIIRMSMREAAYLVSKKYFSVMPVPRNTGEEKNSTQEVIDEVQGIAESYKSQDYAEIIEQHTYYDFDGKGNPAPCIIWICSTSKKVLRIQIRYLSDDEGNAIDELGRPSKEKIAIEYFTKYGFLPNPDGFLDYGLGHMMGKLNISVNRLLRQIEDAGTLANIGNMSGFISESLGQKKGDVTLSMGNFKNIPKTVSNIRDAIYQFNFPGANQSAVNTLGELNQTAQRIGSTTDAVTGNIEKVLQPLSIMTLLESSLQLPTSVMEQMSVSFEDELNKVYKLMRRYYKTERNFADDGKLVIIKPEDFAQEMRITPVLDPKMITSQQKIAKSQELYNFSAANPVIASNQASMREATRRMLVALDTEDLDRILPEPEEPQSIDNQDLENMYFILPKDKQIPFDVYPEHNHAEHIQKIDALIAVLNQLSPQIEIQDPTVMQVIQGFTAEQKQEILLGLLDHRRKHSAYFYAQQQGILNENGLSASGKMEADGSNPIDFEGDQEEVQPGGGVQNMQPGATRALPRPKPGAGLAGMDAPAGILGLAGLDIKGGARA